MIAERAGRGSTPGPKEREKVDPNFEAGALCALDNLEVMRGMDGESVQLIYAAPPFNSKHI